MAAFNVQAAEVLVDTWKTSVAVQTKREKTRQITKRKFFSWQNKYT